MVKRLLIPLLLLLPGAVVCEEAAPLMPPSESMDVRELQVQLERARAVNAQLQSEREALQKQLTELEVRVAAEDRRLKSSVEGDNARLRWSKVGAGGLLVAFCGAAGYWLMRRRKRVAARSGS